MAVAHDEIPATPRRRRRERRWITWGVLSIVAAITLITVPNRLRPDATDDVPAAVRHSVRSAVRIAAGCDLPTSHVASIRPTLPGLGVEHGFAYRCTLTLLGPAITGTAECADGRWQVSGWHDPQVGNEPCGYALR